MTQDSPWRVEADQDLCQGHQLCQAEAPDVFGFDTAADHVTVLMQRPEDARKDAVKVAVKYCPAFALSIEEN